MSDIGSYIHLAIEALEKKLDDEIKGVLSLKPAQPMTATELRSLQASTTLFMGDPKFTPYRETLLRAYNMVASGKGQERHGAGRAWNDQPIMTLGRTHGVGFPLGQAAKKIEESTRMDDEPAVREILGAIGYLCAAVQLIEEGER